MSNKIFNIIMLVLILVFAFVSFYMISLTKENDKSQIFFEIKDFKGVTYIDSESKFTSDGDKLTLVIDGKKIFTDTEFKLDSKTGELIINEDEHVLYLRSVTKDDIVLWYNKRELHLTKEVVLK